MRHKGEIKLLHEGEVVRFHRYVSLTMMKTFFSKYKQDAKHLPGECSIDVIPEETPEWKKKVQLVPRELAPVPFIRPAAIYDNKKFL